MSGVCCSSRESGHALQTRPPQRLRCTAASETLSYTRPITYIHDFLLTCVLKLSSLSTFSSSSPFELHKITMGLLSLLPESLQTVETWIIRVFVCSIAHSFFPPFSSSLTTTPVPARHHYIWPVGSATGLRHRLVHLAICHVRPAADWRPSTWPAAAASRSKSQGTPRWAQATFQPGWSPGTATGRFPPG